MAAGGGVTLHGHVAGSVRREEESGSHFRFSPGFLSQAQASPRPRNVCLDALRRRPPRDPLASTSSTPRTAPELQPVAIMADAEVGLARVVMVG